MLQCIHHSVLSERLFAHEQGAGVFLVANNSTQIHMQPAHVGFPCNHTSAAAQKVVRLLDALQPAVQAPSNVWYSL
jgi:UDP-N-acetylenolpyruvoylglucosamine reductase